VILMSKLVAAIRNEAVSIALPDGSPVETITVSSAERFASQFGLSLRRVEIVALENNIVPGRYLRNLKTFSLADQARLLESRVAVIGLGGLGGMLAENLARMGVGQLVLVDGDRFEEHNLNRQLLAVHSNLGKPKAKEAARRIRHINGAVEIDIHEHFFGPQTARTVLEGVQVAVDCLDDIETRFSLEKAAKDCGIPLISAAVAGFSGHVTTIFPSDEGLRSIYGPPEDLPAKKGAETRLGCLAPAVSLLACLEAAEVCKVLLEKAGNLRNRLLLVDLNDYTFQVLNLT